MLKQFVFAAFSLLLFLAPAQAQKKAINLELLNSAANQQSDLVLAEVPLGLIGVNDAAVVKWSPANAGVLRYSAVPGGGNLSNYPSTLASSDLTVNRGGELQFLGEKIPAGVHYCIITSGSDHSTEFIIVREAEVSARLISPRSARGATGINSNSPTFVWEEVNGVPYYHIFLSDQPFTVVKDENGDTKTEGANVIWQAITSETSIAYGTPDPSGFFTTTDAPPLVKGVRYNWVVLNNYGNNPALSSNVTSGPTGFNVEVPPPFDAPVNLQPAQGQTVTSDFFTLQWSEIEGAALYHVYLSRQEELSGSEALLPIWDGVTSNTLVDLSAGILQQEGTYYWKVLAQNESGNGAMGDTTSFYFSTRSATVNFRTVDLDNQIVPRSSLELVSQTYGATPLVLPADDNGFIDRTLPLGTYEVTATRKGFEDTTVVFQLATVNETKNLKIYLRPSPSRIYGSTRDGQQNALGFTLVTAVSQSTGEQKETTSDINGNFSLPLTSDNWTLTARKSSYKSPSGRSLFLGQGENIDLDESANGGPLVLTKNAFTLDGFVLTPASEAIWGATVTATQGSQTERALSDAQGKYNLTLGAGDWRLVVAKDGYVGPQPQTVSVIDHNLSLNLTLTPKANIISGTVVSDGVPLKNATVVAIPNSGQEVRTTTDNFGQYTLSLGRGTYQVMPQKNGYISPEPSQFALSVGQTLSGVDFVMTAQSSYITGEVTSDGVTPLAGVTVTNGTQTTTTGANGRYQLGVLHGSHTVSASKTGYLASASQSVTLTPGQTLSGISFVLTPNASVISGTVKNGNLAVRSANLAAVQQSTGATYTAATDADGRFSLSLPSGTYTLSASKTGFVSSPGTMTVTVNPGQTAPNKNFSFVENVSYVSGQVKSSSGPLRNVSVLVQAIEDASKTFSTVTGVDGNFSLSVQPELTYKITASKSGYVTGSQNTAKLQLAQTTNILLTLAANQSLVLGKVTSQNGTAVASATVKAVSSTSTFSAQTDASGKYALGVDAGSYDLTVQKSGYLPSTKTLTLGVGDTLSGTNVTLTSNFATLDGVITEAGSGQTIEGCLVVATESSSQAGGSTYTSSQGHYLIQSLPLGVYTVTISHPSYSSKTLSNQVFAGGSSNKINATLTAKSGRISGQVTSSGTGVQGVSVTATAAGVSVSAVTGSSGSYTISNVAPGSFTVQVSLTGYTSSEPKTVSVAANGTGTANFTVTANAGKISGFVKEGEVGLSGAQVVASGANGNAGSTTSQADGSYTLSNLAPDAYQVSVVLDRYASSPETASVTLGAGGTATQNFSLNRSEVKIAGRVVNQAGSPLVNIQVAGESGKGEASSTTDASGNFELADLPGRASYIVGTDIFAEGFENGDSLVVVGSADVSGVVLEVAVRSAKIRGNVGLADATITAEHLARGVRLTATSKQDGSFVLKNLYDGNYRISVARLGYRVTPSTRDVSSVGIGEERTGVNFDLTEIKVAISGKVKDSDGTPVANAPVLAWSAPASGRDTTAADGSFSIRNLPPNLSYTLQTKLSNLDFDNGSLDVALGESDASGKDLSVVIHNSGIQGKVTDNNGAAVSGALVRLAGLDSVTYSDAGGLYAFAHLRGGSYDLQVSKEGMSSVPATTISLAKSEIKTVNFSGLTALARAVSGVVSDADGRLKNVAVQVTEQTSGTVVKKDTTDAGGIYALENLDSGKLYTVQVSRKGYSKATRTDVSVTSGAVTADFTMTPVANAIIGKVIDKATGAVVANAQVQINGVNGGVWSDDTDGFGYFAVTGLLSTTYSVVSQNGGLVSRSETVNLAAGATAKLVLELERPAQISGTVTYQGSGRAGATITATDPLAGVVVSAVSDAGGNYLVTGLQEGEYTASCLIAGFSAEMSPQTVTLAAGETGTADFTLIAESNAIIGTVADPDGQLLQGAKVRVWNDSFSDSTTSDLNGQFQMNDLADGAYQVSASLGGHTAPAPQSVSLTGGQPALVDILLTPLQNSISGFARDGQSGRGVASAPITATDESGNVSYDTTAGDGSYLFELGAAGTYSLQAEKSGYESSSVEEVVLQPGKAVTRDLILTPIFSTSAISGTVTQGGVAVAGAKVFCSSLTDASLRDSVVTSASGAYRFDGLPAPAEYVLQVRSDGLNDLDSPVLELTASPLVYDFLFASGRIQLKVTRNGVTPLSGVVVNLSRGSQDLRLITDSAGEGATESNLTKGSYQVSVEKDGNEILPARYPLTLPDDTTKIVEEIQLPFIAFAEDSVAAKETMQVQLVAFVTPADTLWLSYKGLDKPGFESLALQFVRSSGDSLFYAATVPAQDKPGQMAYFIHTEFDGRSYSNETTPFTAEVTNEGILTQINLSPAARNVPPKVPVVLHARAYDGINKLLTPTTVRWQIASGAGTLSNFSDDSTKVWFTSDIDTTSTIAVQVTRGDVALSATAQVVTQQRELGSLNVNASVIETSNENAVTFSYAAVDTGGSVMYVYPLWDFEPANSGQLIPNDAGESATFVPNPEFFGQVRISLRDSLSGTVAAFNAEEDLNEGDVGLKVFQVVTENSPDVQVTDGEGFSLTIPAGSVEPGVQMKFKLRKPQVPTVKRFTGEYSVVGGVFDITVTGQFKEGSQFDLQLPVTEGEMEESDRLAVGHWDVNALNWDLMESSAGSNSLRATTTHFSEFAVLQLAEPLGLHDVRLLPNPFTPHDQYGLQISFNLTSNDVRQPWVTVKIYNMAGDLVRTLVENQPMAPLEYAPGDDTTLSWDGRTDAGTLARNGRYIVRIKVRDSSGEKEVIKTVVLIK